MSEHEGACSRDMSQRLVAATKSRAMHTKRRVAGTHSRDKIAAISHTRKCGRDMSQKPVARTRPPTCGLTLHDKLVLTSVTPGRLLLGSMDFLIHVSSFVTKGKICSTRLKNFACLSSIANSVKNV